MTRKYKVLIIEDEPDIVDLHVVSLEEMGCEPIVAVFDLEKMKEQVEGCDFILSDFNLGPDMDYDVVAEIASRCNKPLIMCSGYMNNRLLKEVQFDYYVAKPYAAEDLRDAVEKCKELVEGD